MNAELLYGYRVIKKVTEVSAQQRLQSEYLQKSYRKFLYSHARKNTFAKYLYIFEIFRIFLFIVLKIDRSGDDKELIYFAATQNQNRQINTMKLLYLHDRDFMSLDLRTNKRIKIKNLRFLWVCLRALPTLFRYSRNLYRYDDAISIKNNVLFLCAYQFSKQFLKQHSPNAVVAANDHSPLPLGFAGAARSLGIKTIYIQHAHVTHDLPVLRFNLAILDGESARVIYEDVGAIPAYTNIIYRGLEGEEGPMRLQKIDGKQKLIVGLFVNIFDEHVLEKTLRVLLDHKNIKHILLREHPAFPIDTQKINFCENVSVSKTGTRLQDDAEKCDIVLGGNSSFHLSVLKYGVPCVFYDALDYIKYDDYGFLKHDIIYETTDISTLDFKDVKRYYSAKDWPERFRYFDDFYQKDVTSHNAQVRKTLLLLLK